MAANATAHLHFVMAGTRQQGGKGERWGSRLQRMELSDVGAWLSPPIVKMLTARVHDWNNTKYIKKCIYKMSSKWFV